MQRVHIAPDKCLRFRKNRIVDKLLEVASANGYSLNEIAIDAAAGKYTKDEQRQLAQLIGYSVSGYGDLSYVTDRAWAAAYQAVQESSVPERVKRHYR